MEKTIEKAVVSVVAGLYQPKVYRAEKYLSDKLVVRATRPRYNKKLSARNQNMQLTLVIGRPNWNQKRFIKTLKKAGEPFPVRMVILKFVK